MSLLLCDLAKGLYYLVYVYTALLFIYALLSWVPELRRGRWVWYLAAVIEPVLAPVRRIIPPAGGFDIAFLVVILLLQVLIRPMLGTLAFDTCIAI